MGFTIICNKCKNEDVMKDKHFGDIINDGIGVDVTENRTIVGNSVESINIVCWKCENEINI